MRQKSLKLKESRDERILRERVEAALILDAVEFPFPTEFYPVPIKPFDKV